MRERGERGEREERGKRGERGERHLSKSNHFTERLYWERDGLLGPTKIPPKFHQELERDYIGNNHGHDAKIRLNKKITCFV